MTERTLPGSERVVRRSARHGLADSVLGTRNLMTVAALSVVGMIILIPLNYVTPATGSSPDTVWLGCALMGFWTIPFLLPAAVIRRPGATLIASLIIGVVCVFTTPSGPAALVGNAIGGLLIELPLAVMLYRHWKWWSYLISAAFFGAVNGGLYLTLLQQVIGISAAGPIMATAIVSSLIGGLAVIGLTRLLHRAGVGIRHLG